MKLTFTTDADELEFWRNLGSRLYYGQGRLTAYASYDLDYAWDMLEGYFKDRNQMETLF